jgi:hypothetical protein
MNKSAWKSCFNDFVGAKFAAIRISRLFYSFIRAASRTDSYGELWEINVDRSICDLACDGLLGEKIFVLSGETRLRVLPMEISVGDVYPPVSVLSCDLFGRRGRGISL